MNLVLDISTSAEFWRRVYPIDRAPSSPSKNPKGDCAITHDEVFRLAPQWITPHFLQQLDGKLHVMAFDLASRRRSSEHVVHVWSDSIPQGSFYKLNDSVFVAAPEFIFLAAASVLNKHALIAFGCELCGFYGFDESDPRGFRSRKVPLLTIEKLERYLAASQSCRGFQNAKAALPHIVAHSASPMETFDVMAITLPYRLGGYGLRRPLMNNEVKLTEDAKRIAKKRTCYGDMSYPEISLDIEHYGQYDHTLNDDWANDRARANALKRDGFEVIELTKDQVGDLIAFECIIKHIAKHLGKRLRADKLGPIPPRLEMRSNVFAWNASSGRLR